MKPSLLTTILSLTPTILAFNAAITPGSDPLSSLPPDLTQEEALVMYNLTSLSELRTLMSTPTPCNTTTDDSCEQDVAGTFVEHKNLGRAFSIAEVNQYRGDQCGHFPDLDKQRIVHRYPQGLRCINISPYAHSIDIQKAEHVAVRAYPHTHCKGKHTNIMNGHKGRKLHIRDMTCMPVNITAAHREYLIENFHTDMHMGNWSKCEAKGFERIGSLMMI